jgi:hypothetical protein
MMQENIVEPNISKAISQDYVLWKPKSLFLLKMDLIQFLTTGSVRFDIDITTRFTLITAFSINNFLEARDELHLGN